MKNQAMRAVIILSIIAIAGFLLADCTSGQWKHLECKVLRHQYVPQWEEVTSDTDSDGNTTYSTTHHPEEFHVFTLDLEDQTEVDVNTLSATYFRVQDGDVVTVKVRKGRWTKANWLPAIE